MSDLAGRPLLSGAAVGVQALPGSLLLGLTGLCYGLGFDGLAYGLGLVGGAALFALAISGVARVGETRTVVGWLRHRFGAAIAGLAALAVVIGAGLLLAAELAAAGGLARLLGVGSRELLIVVGVIAMAGVALSRSARISAALYTVAAIGLLVAVTTLSLSVDRASMPLTAYGSALQEIEQIETSLLGKGMADFKTFSGHTKPFVALDGLGATALVVTLMAGVAVLMSLRAWRTGAQSGFAAHGVLFAALVAMIPPAMAAYAKLGVYRALDAGIAVSALPRFLDEGLERGLVRVYGLSVPLFNDVTGAVLAGATDAAQTAARLSDSASPRAQEFQDLKPQVKTALIEAAKTFSTASGVAPLESLKGSVLPQALLAHGNKTDVLPHGAIAIEPLGVLLVAQSLSGAPLVFALALGLAIFAALAQAGGGLARAIGEAIADVVPAASPFASGIALAALALAGLSALTFEAGAAVHVAIIGLAVLGSALFVPIVIGAWWQRASSLGAALAIVSGLVVSGYYAGATSLAPAHFYGHWANFSNASDMAARKFESLSQAVIAAPDEARRADAEIALDTFARGTDQRPNMANWLGIDGASATIFALPGALLVMLLLSLFRGRRN